MQLASRFGRHSPVLRANSPLADDQIRSVAPSIFAEAAHDSRSERYTYIPTSTVLDGLRKEGFQPFMVAQTRVRDETRKEFTKHMIRLRHASDIAAQEANEIILLNSHDGTSSYQMLAGVFRFACQNGLVVGETLNDVRIPHKGSIVDNVIEGAFRILDDFEEVTDQRETMKALTLNDGEQSAFARAALSLKFEDKNSDKPIPVTESQVLMPKRFEDRKNDLWTTFNRVQENLVRGGMVGRSATGRPMRTRAVTGIDSDIKLNRALWILAESMRELKAA